jgi:imidazolonepropionase-like amidohydrolase
MMVKYGLTPSEALACSIINGPTFFGLQNEYGAVAEHKKADLLILNANPLVEIQNTRTIDGFIRNGKYLDRKNLDNLLQHVLKEISVLK